jgi:nicotinamidase-related amidase
MRVTLPAALLIVDVQKAIDDPAWCALGPRSTPLAEAQIARLLAHWRQYRWPIVHLRHSSPQPDSSYCARGPGFPFKYPVQTGPKERVVTKRTNSGFINTALHAELKQLHCDRLVVCGVTTNHSVDATVRHAAGLGYEVVVATDACSATALQTAAGQVIDAEQVQATFLANLAGEYCQLKTCDQIMACA